MLKAPFPYFGGKSRVCEEVWSRFGAVRNYVEPFAGSLAVLLGRPLPFDGVETVNDKDGLLANFWRAMKMHPEEVAHHADWPVNEADLHARHLWLVGQRESLTARLMGDPSWCDPVAAGWWVWGISTWIGSGWCAGEGCWISKDGVFQKRDNGDGDSGVNYQRPHLGNLGQGVHKKRPHLGNLGQGDALVFDSTGIEDMRNLQDRLRHVRVCCGDWQRVVQESVVFMSSGVPCAVFLDPPYATEADRDMGLYAMESGTVAHEVREWCKQHGNDPRLRIALAGYEVEHSELESLGWSVWEWKALGGMSNGSKEGRGFKNKGRERIWFSPHCLSMTQHTLF